MLSLTQLLSGFATLILLGGFIATIYVREPYRQSLISLAMFYTGAVFLTISTITNKNGLNPPSSKDIVFGVGVFIVTTCFVVLINTGENPKKNSLKIVVTLITIGMMCLTIGSDLFHIDESVNQSKITQWINEP